VVQVLPSEAEFAVVVAEGDLDDDQLLTAYEEYLQRDPVPLTLWDLSKARLDQIDAVALRALARRVAELGKRVRSRNARSAVVCARPEDFGLARMLMMYLVVEGYPVRIAAFMNRDEAKAWLRCEDAE
jgi:hypothetical protein